MRKFRYFALDIDHTPLFIGPFKQTSLQVVEWQIFVSWKKQGLSFEKQVPL
jgi:hypothetical protein